MPDEPPSILPRGIIIRWSRKPSPAPPGSAVYIQSVSGSSCNIGHAAGICSAGGGAPPASTSATVVAGSSDNREAITAPAEPAPMTTKSNCPAIACPLNVRCRKSRRTSSPPWLLALELERQAGKDEGREKDGQKPLSRASEGDGFALDRTPRARSLPTRQPGREACFR